MKKVLFVLSIAMLAAGCSSGTTVADLPSNVTSRFSGTFQNTPNTQSGGVTIDIQDVDGVVSGNIIFNAGGDNCLRNSTVTGNSSGFNLTLTAEQAGQRSQVTLTEREPNTPEGAEGALVSETVFFVVGGAQGTSITTLSNGNILTRVTDAPMETMGTLNMQFTIANGGNDLNGTYTTTGDICSNQTGSGTMNLSR